MSEENDSPESRKSQPRGDFYSGIPWVYVTREQAWAHPKGRLGVVLWAIGLMFIGVGLTKGWLIYGVSDSLGLALFNALWPVLTGAGLLLRVPWAVYLAVVSAGFTIYALIRGFGDPQSVFYLMETVAYVGALFYLIDGDRPNLIYRHRYRQYSALKEIEGHDDKG